MALFPTCLLDPVTRLGLLLTFYPHEFSNKQIYDGDKYKVKYKDLKNHS